MDVDALRARYLPKTITVLFVAEAKPDSTERFFYYDNVAEKDYLYVYLMRVLYDKTDINWLRANKRQMLERFKADGYYLIDAADAIAARAKSGERRAIIAANMPKKLAEIDTLLRHHGSTETPIVVLTSTVFDVLYAPLSSVYTVINDGKIYFPSYGWQQKFIEQMTAIKPAIQAAVKVRDE